ncbi:MAG TPA: hypothetical protein VF406_10335 [Thermodesulfobacteriota bacterium]
MKTPFVALAVALAAIAATPAAARPIEEIARDRRMVIETAAPSPLAMPAGKTVNGESDGSGAPSRAERKRVATYPSDLRPATDRDR